MNKYGAYHQKEEHASAFKEHKDFQSNLLKSKELIKNIIRNLPKGMKIYAHENLLFICWIAPRHERFGSFTRPIFLHQSSGDFSKEVEHTLNLVMDVANQALSQIDSRLEVDSENMFTNDLVPQKLASTTQYGMKRWIDTDKGKKAA